LNPKGPLAFPVHPLHHRLSEAFKSSFDFISAQPISDDWRKRSMADRSYCKPPAMSAMGIRRVASSVSSVRNDAVSTPASFIANHTTGTISLNNKSNHLNGGLFDRLPREIRDMIWTFAGGVAIIRPRRLTSKTTVVFSGTSLALLATNHAIAAEYRDVTTKRSAVGLNQCLSKPCRRVTITPDIRSIRALRIEITFLKGWDQHKTEDNALIMRSFFVLVNFVDQLPNLRTLTLWGHVRGVSHEMLQQFIVLVKVLKWDGIKSGKLRRFRGSVNRGSCMLREVWSKSWDEEAREG
jgi:hypothetical protein